MGNFEHTNGWYGSVFKLIIGTITDEEAPIATVQQSDSGSCLQVETANQAASGS